MAKRNSPKYNANASILVNVFLCRTSVVPFVVCRLEFWIFFIFHLFICWCYRKGWLLGADVKATFFHIEWNYMKVISVITTFFEVFYTNQTFVRYMHLHKSTKDLLSIVSEFTFELSLYTKENAEQHMRLASRFMLAGVLMFLLQLTDCGAEEVWLYMEQHGLIKQDERQYLEMNVNITRRPYVMLHWAAKITRAGHRHAVEADPDRPVPSNTLKPLIDQIVAARSEIQDIGDTLSLLIPYQYFHLLNLMVVVNLVLWAYGMGVTDSAFAPIVFFFAALIFMGMMELASQLSNPFGDDATDFPLWDWADTALDEVYTILEHPLESKHTSTLLHEDEPAMEYSKVC